MKCAIRSTCPSRPMAFRCLSRRGLASPSLKPSLRTFAAAEHVPFVPDGEWPATLSLSLYEDLREYYTPELFKQDAQPGTIINHVMSPATYFSTPEDSLMSLEKKFERVSGLPVLENGACVGLISKKDAIKANWKGDVKAVMSTPPITCAPDSLVVDAAALMLKYKIGRIPVVNAKNEVVGMVSRSDIFTALTSTDEF